MLLNTLHEVKWRLSNTSAPEIKIAVTKWLYESLKGAGFEMKELSRNCSGHRIILISKMKECLICGNQKTKELEPATLHSDGDGNDTEEKVYICKEGNGCC